MNSIVSSNGVDAVLYVAAGICLKSQAHVNREVVLVAMLCAQRYLWSKSVAEDEDFKKDLACLGKALKAGGVPDSLGFCGSLAARCGLGMPDAPAVIDFTITDKDNTKTPKAIMASGTLMAVEDPMQFAWTQAIGHTGGAGPVRVSSLARTLLSDPGEAFSATCAEYGTTVAAIRDSIA